MSNSTWKTAIIRITADTQTARRLSLSV